LAGNWPVLARINNDVAWKRQEDYDRLINRDQTPSATTPRLDGARAAIPDPPDRFATIAASKHQRGRAQNKRRF